MQQTIESYLKDITLRNRNFLRLDVFGSDFRFIVQGTNKSYRTLFGAFLTVISYSIGLAYLIYYISLWTQGRVVPTISQISRNHIDDVYVPLSMSPFAVQFYFYGDQPDLQGRLPFSPILRFYLGDAITEIEDGIIPCAYTEESFVKYNTNTSFCLNTSIPELSQLVLSPTKDGVTTYLEFVLQKCQERYLKPGQTCASREETIAYLNTPWMEYQQMFVTQEYNLQTDQIENIANSKFTYLETAFYQQSYIEFISVKSHIDDNILFTSPHEVQYISSFDFFSFSLSQETLRKKMELEETDEVYASTVLSLSIKGADLQVRKKKLGEILAEVGSIFGVVLQLGIIGRWYSGYKLDQVIQERLLENFFPEYQQIEKYFKVNKTKFQKHESLLIINKNSQVKGPPQDVVLEGSYNYLPPEEPLIQPPKVLGVNEFIRPRNTGSSQNQIEIQLHQDQVSVSPVFQDNLSAFVGKSQKQPQTAKENIISYHTYQHAKNAILHKIHLKYFLLDSFTTQKGSVNFLILLGLQFLMDKTIQENLDLYGLHLKEYRELYQNGQKMERRATMAQNTNNNQTYPFISIQKSAELDKFKKHSNPQVEQFMHQIVSNLIIDIKKVVKERDSKKKTKSRWCFSK